MCECDSVCEPVCVNECEQVGGSGYACVQGRAELQKAGVVSRAR